MVRREVKIIQDRVTKNMQQNIVELSLKCMRQVTKVICTICWWYWSTYRERERAKSICEMSAMVTNCASDPLDGFVDLSERLKRTE